MNGRYRGFFEAIESSLSSLSAARQQANILDEQVQAEISMLRAGTILLHDDELSRLLELEGRYREISIPGENSASKPLPPATADTLIGGVKLTEPPPPLAITLPAGYDHVAMTDYLNGHPYYGYGALYETLRIDALRKANGPCVEASKIEFCAENHTEIRSLILQTFPGLKKRSRGVIEKLKRDAIKRRFDIFCQLGLMARRENADAVFYVFSDRTLQWSDRLNESVMKASKDRSQKARTKTAANRDQSGHGTN